MTQKYFHNLSINDNLQSGRRFAKITRILKASYEAEVEGGAKIKISSRTGQQFGTHSYWNYCEDVEAAKEAIAQERLLTQTLHAAAERSRQERFEAVKLANIDIDLTVKSVFGKLQSVEFVNSKGQKALMLFEVTEKMVHDEEYNFFKGWCVEKVHVYVPSKYEEQGYNFSQPNDDFGAMTVADAIYKAITYYWN